MQLRTASREATQCEAGYADSSTKLVYPIWDNLTYLYPLGSEMKYIVSAKKNLPFILLPVMVVKFLLQPTIPDALVILVLTALTAYYHFLEDRKAEDPSAEFKRDLAAMKDDIKQNREQVNALKISASFAPRR